jgi:methylated-DNA-[protein]-cysteine S-methyltransferase
MSALRFAVFPTALGSFGIAWGECGIVAIQLPEARQAVMRQRMLREFPDAQEALPPADVQVAIDGITGLLRGQRVDLAGIALDMARVPAFHRQVYEVARTVPPGTTTTYGEIAAQLGAPDARGVGQALAQNPFSVVVPCHRVLAAGGKLGGFSARGGVATKIRLLTIEGALAAPAPSLFDGDGALGFDPAAAVAHLRAVDPRLALTVDAVGPFAMELKTAPSLFLALAEAIVYQQLTGKAAETIFARVRALFPRPHQGPTAEQLLRASDERLRGAGLSGAKVLALRDLARRAARGEIPTLGEAHGMRDDELVQRLTAVRGIGRWTVEMLLMFRLGRPDVLPVDDYGIRKGFAVAFGKRALPTPAAVAEHGARWAPYRTAASWYLWRAAERGA